VGTLDRIENSVCAVDLTGASLTLHGDDLDVKLPITFKAGFEGPTEIKLWEWDKKGTRTTDGLSAGQWVVGSPEPHP